jgi:HSP20 family protein
MGMLMRYNNRGDFLDNFFSRTIFDDLFDLPTPVAEAKSFSLNKADVKEESDKYTISLVAPGLEKADFNISMQGGELTLSYDVGDKTDCHTYATNYKKKYTLPNNCDFDNIDATYKSGVLVVIVPKTEAAKPRTIEVK